MQVTSFVLKIIAIICMLIDHTSFALESLIPYEMHDLYVIGRGIGRTAFPLFCFMIVEGYYHTRNRWRYLLSLAILAFISELPFDAVFSENGFKLEFYYQNVFFTLAAGLVAIIILDNINKIMKKYSENSGNIVFGFMLTAFNVLIQIFTIQIMLFAAGRLESDYGSLGLELILLIYYFEKIPALLGRINRSFGGDRAKFVFAGLAVLVWLANFDMQMGRINELMGLPAVILIMYYNGRRGNYKIPKYVFYFFYPLHLIILYFIRKTFVGY